ncbi:hypothetical protein GIB67_001618 [Kingdonia uniflora]|uniref:Molybdate-anion transporter n=1 Tax=Kingdonia uniflora TaxID=39325 RepID=A0A7J7L0U3_9MAGN|nr:hypothetical protein GIB67_001618 [Kingdonia uniflora]
MEMFYLIVFGGLSMVVAILELSKNNKDRINTSSTFNAFKNNYVVVYSLMMAGDWLQGPYVYYLYTTYGFGKGDIGRLFIAGFGSSMLFGTIRGFEQQWLSVTFSKAIFFGNGLVAIIAGLFGNVLADTLGFGPVAPFDAAACFLAIGMAIIMSSWSENFGDPSESKDLFTQFKGAAVAIASALSPNEEDIPHGFIFATFMLSSMLGSSIASRLLARSSPKVESYMQIVFAISALTFLLPIITSLTVAPSKVKGGSISFAGSIQLLGFCVFEACVGLFWPSIMKMRSQYIPEESRSTIMNFFRIPLNIFVCIVLYNVNAFPITVMFGMCSIFLFMSSILQRRLMVVAESHKSKSQDRTSMKDRDTEAEPLNI